MGLAWRLIGDGFMQKLKWIIAIVVFNVSTSIMAMGLRSFVALPLEQGGMVFRLQDLETLNSNKM